MNGCTTSLIESAAWGIGSMDDAIRLRCRNAPVEVRRNIDTRREARGLPRLWSDTRPRNVASRARAAAAVARLKAFLRDAHSRREG